MSDKNLQVMLGQQILDLTTGYPTDDTLQAQAAALATSIGGVCFLSGMSLDDALGALADLQIGMAQHISENWGQVQRGDH